jgi:peptidoglycan/LPS O-acetylase OafA/YrhL
LTIAKPLTARDGTEIVDGLRGFAILLVVGFHTWLFSWLIPALTIGGVAHRFDFFARIGYLGVDLFFLISGFCLFYPYAREAIEGSAPMSIVQFARRRALKILPSYALALLATAALAAPAFTSIGDAANAFIAHALFVQNAFNEAYRANNTVLWSLAIEVQFYLIFPFLARAFLANAPLTFSGLVGAALVYRLGTAQCCFDVETIRRQLPAWLDVFACGMLAAYAYVWVRRHLPELAHARRTWTLCALGATALGLLLLVQADAAQDLHNGREGWQVLNRSLLAGVGAVLIVSSCFAASWWRALLANRILVFLSVVSYNLYLWHTIIELWLVQHRLPHPATLNPHDDPRWKFAYVALSLISSLAVATALTYVLERPILSTVHPQPFCLNYRRLIDALRSRFAKDAIGPGTR